MKVYNFLLLLLGTGLSLFAQDTDNYYFKKIVKKQKAGLIYLNIELPAGILTLDKGTDECLEARFSYVHDKMAPEVSYHESGKIGNLDIKVNVDDINVNSEEDNKWNITLNEEIIYDLDLDFGAGIGNMNFSSIPLRDLDLSLGAGKFNINLTNTSLPTLNFNAGAGEATIDLSGEWDNNFNGDFNCGVGKITLKLPRNTGVKVDVTGLLGSVNHPGLNKRRQTYTNEVFGKTKTHLDININGAIGEINLILVD